MFNSYIEGRIRGTWREEHKKVVENILIYINKISDCYILKGSMALMECYNLPRFSEDICLDGRDKKLIFKIVDMFAKEKHFSYNIVKNTGSVVVFMLDYGDKNGRKTLKIEMSYLSPKLDSITCVNNIHVYTINRLAMLKAEAYLQRDELKDLFDLTFIYNNLKRLISDFTIDLIYDVVAYKGIEQFDYLVKKQQDELINVEELKKDFLRMCDSLHLLGNRIMSEM